MPEIVTLPGVKGKFIAGLSWRHEDRKPSRKVLRARAEPLDASWAATHKTRTGHFQAGFCAPLGGVKSSEVKSLASLIADSHPQPWFGIYKLADNQCWYIAVRDGQEVLPDGDQVGTFEEMQAAHQAHLHYGEWHDFSGTERDLASVAKQARRPDSLTDIYGETRRLVGAAVAAVIVGTSLILGYQWYVQHKREQDRAAALARQVAQQAMLTAQNAKQHIQPWTVQPVPSAVIAACGSAWHTQPLSSEGWILASWSCKVTSDLSPRAITVTETWQRADGLAMNAPGELLDSERSCRSRMIQIPFEPPHGHNDDIAAAVSAAYSFAQANSVLLTLTDTSAGAALPGATTADPAVVDAWKTSGVDFTFPISPWLGFAEGLDAVPALRVTEIKLDAEKKWHTLGHLYAVRAPILGNGNRAGGAA